METEKTDKSESEDASKTLHSENGAECGDSADIERQKKIQKKAEQMTPEEIDKESKDSKKDKLCSSDGGRSFEHLDDETATEL